MSKQLSNFAVDVQRHGHKREFWLAKLAVLRSHPRVKKVLYHPRVQLAYKRANLVKYNASKAVDAVQRGQLSDIPSFSSLIGRETSAPALGGGGGARSLGTGSPGEKGEAVARVAFVVTKETRAKLEKLGHTPAVVRKLRPEEALRIVEAGVGPDDLDSFLDSLAAEKEAADAAAEAAAEEERARELAEARARAGMDDGSEEEKEKREREEAAEEGVVETALVLQEEREGKGGDGDGDVEDERESSIAATRAL